MSECDVVTMHLLFAMGEKVAPAPPELAETIDAFMKLAAEHLLDCTVCVERTEAEWAAAASSAARRFGVAARPFSLKRKRLHHEGGPLDDGCNAVNTGTSYVVHRVDAGGKALCATAFGNPISLRRTTKELTCSRCKRLSAEQCGR